MPVTKNEPVLVSDLGQVLLRFDLEKAWQAIRPHFDYEGDDFRIRLVQIFEESRFGAGGVTGEEFHRQLCEQMGLCIGLQEFAEAWSDMFWVDDRVIDLLVNAPFSRRYILSNTNELHWEFIKSRYSEVLNLFDAHYTSHEVGLEKPDLALYRHVEEDAGASAQQIFFIDDLPPNIEGARAAGWDAALHLDADSLEAQLRQRGLRG